MSLLSLTLLSFSMSMDAFAAAICKGAASTEKVRWRDLFATGLVFGIVETMTPLLGWLAGHSMQSFIADYDHWIAFILLSILGVRMMYESWQHHNKEVCDDEDCCCQPRFAQKKQGVWVLILTAIATSIDSMVVGVSLAFLEVNICLTALMIGLATTFMAMLGMRLGKWLGNQVGKRAEFVGGLILVLIGTSILCEHLFHQ